MSKVEQDARNVLLESLLQKNKASVSICQEIVKTLAPVLERDKIYELSLDDSIFTRFDSGLIFHAPVPLMDEITKRDLVTRTHFVGVLANTVSLIDSVSRRALEPGAYVVRLRPLLRQEFAFDFVDGNDRMALSTRAVPTDSGGFEDLPEKPQALRINLGIVNASIGQRSCIDAISGADPLPGPTFPGPTLPPGGVCYREICVSFLIWKACFIMRSAETVAVP